MTSCWRTCCCSRNSWEVCTVHVPSRGAVFCGVPDRPCATADAPCGSFVPLYACCAIPCVPCSCSYGRFCAPVHILLRKDWRMMQKKRKSASWDGTAACMWPGLSPGDLHRYLKGWRMMQKRKKNASSCHPQGASLCGTAACMWPDLSPGGLHRCPRIHGRKMRRSQAQEMAGLLLQQ